jgi:AcrR family transcriptional regulator
MGIIERRERDKQRRTNDILDAAEKVFFKHGLSQVTMDQVAEEAELSKGTLYLYFKNKEDLYLAINARGLKIMKEMFQQAVGSGATGLEKIEAIGRAYYRFFTEYPDYFNTLVYYEALVINPDEMNDFAKECDQQGNEAIELLASSIAEGIIDGSVRSALDPLKTAIFLWGQATGIIQILHTKGAHLSKTHGMNLDDIYPYSMEIISQALKT